MYRVADATASRLQPICSSECARVYNRDGPTAQAASCKLQACSYKKLTFLSRCTLDKITRSQFKQFTVFFDKFHQFH